MHSDAKITAISGRSARSSLARSLEGAPSISGIVEILQSLNFEKSADRIAALHQMCNEDANEHPLDVDSVRHLARFLVSEPQLPAPRIAVSPDGLMQIEWRLPPGGIVAIQFLIDGRLEFAAIEGSATPQDQRDHVGGAHHKDFVLNAITPFLNQAISRTQVEG